MFSNLKIMEGALLRMERVRLKRGIKEVAANHCSVSTLSKIERGKQQARPALLDALYDELGIHYTQTPDFMAEVSSLMQDFFNAYRFNFKDAIEFHAQLLSHHNTLKHSPLAIHWRVIQALINPENDVLESLDVSVDVMTSELKAWYFSVDRFDLDRDETLSRKRRARDTLQNSYGWTKYLEALWNYGYYGDVIRVSQQALTVALNEGSTWGLAQSYILVGSAYSAYNLEFLMLENYQRSIHLLHNSDWADALDGVYYNIGATYISLGNYSKALTYLERCDKLGFNYFHKMCCIYLALNDSLKVALFLEKMSETADSETEQAILEVTQYQCHPDSSDHTHYLSTLEALMASLYTQRRFGYYLFHHNALRDAYTSVRRYRDALELECRVSQIRSDIVL